MRKVISLLMAFLFVLAFNFTVQAAETPYVVKADMRVETLPANAVINVKPGILVPAEGILNIKVFLENAAVDPVSFDPLVGYVWIKVDVVQLYTDYKVLTYLAYPPGEMKGNGIAPHSIKCMSDIIQIPIKTSPQDNVFSISPNLAYLIKVSVMHNTGVTDVLMGSYSEVISTALISNLVIPELKGDVNGDGKVDIKDLEALKRIIIDNARRHKVPVQSQN